MLTYRYMDDVGYNTALEDAAYKSYNSLRAPPPQAIDRQKPDGYCWFSEGA